MLRAGSPVEMVVNGNARPATAKPVSEEQIMNLLGEALGATYAPGVSGQRTYQYASPAGMASVEVRFRVVASPAVTVTGAVATASSPLYSVAV